jgi:hypothetical protein
MSMSTQFFGKQFCENNFVDDLNVCNCIDFLSVMVQEI